MDRAAWYNPLVTVVATCVNHVAREAIGVCVECRDRVCAECSTKVEGINYCVRCLRRLAGHDQRDDRTTAPSAGWSQLSLGAWVVALTVMAWLLVQAGLPG